MMKYSVKKYARTDAILTEWGDSMKGTEPIWIIGAIVLMIIVVVIMVTLVMSGRSTATGAVSQADLIGCCTNCCTRSYECNTGGGKKSLNDLWSELHMGGSAPNSKSECKNIPLCACPD